MYVKGVLRFVEIRQATEKYKAAAVYRIEETTKEGKPVLFDVQVKAEATGNHPKVGEKIEIPVSCIVTQSGGLFIREA